MRSSGSSGLGKRQPDRPQAGDAQRHHRDRPPILYIVGLGPGSLDHLSPRAQEVLAGCDTIAGYTTYIDLIRPLVQGKQVISTGMQKEVERVEAAIDAALGGRTTAVVSSGDAGIYAMAGLILEIGHKRGLRLQGSPAPGDPGVLQIEIVPGIPALAAGAALLGAPLTHDFAVVSLSDLLTPWETIARRLDAAARADFVIVLYNPRSRRRRDHLSRACGIVGQHRAPDTPAGVVTGASRSNQRVHVTTLAELPEAVVDMQTIVFIGNSTTFTYQDFMVTPRGYGRKYDIS